MIAFNSILIPTAERAGIAVPHIGPHDDIESSEWMLTIRNTHPHLFVYLSLQRGRPLPSPDAHWENARVIAAVPDDRIRTVTLGDLRDMGLSV